MSHPFHVYIIQQIEERLKKHSVVVLDDPRCEFAPFTDKLLQSASAVEEIDRVNLGGLSTSVVRYQGSFFAMDNMSPKSRRNSG
jgi:hypothetical protein